MPEPIIDNTDVKLHDSLTRACEYADTLDIAVGYFHVSGFDELRQSLARIKQIRLIMGDETDYLTAKQLKKGHDPMDIMYERISEILNNTPDVDTSDALMELYEYCKSGRMKVRVYVRNKFHAKAYILRNGSNKSAFIGSSNLSRAGLGYEGGNVELNFLAKDMMHVDALSKWYETIWEKSVKYNDELIKIIKTTEPYARSQNDKEYVTPRELFKIMANELLDSDVQSDDDMLAEFQKIGVINAQNKIRKFGGVIIADSVGLGKTYIGMELIRRAQDECRNALVIVPASVEYNWKREIDIFGAINLDELRLRILTTEKLSRMDPSCDEWESLLRYDFIVVDEAHRFRKYGTYNDGEYIGNKNHANLISLKCGRDVQCVLLTATPLNNTVDDLKNLIDIFTNEAMLRNYNSELSFSHFEEYRKNERYIKNLRKNHSDGVDKQLPHWEQIEKLKQRQEPHIRGIVDILNEIMILRTRSDINKRYPGLRINGKPMSFQPTELEHMRCTFPKEYVSLYEGAATLLENLHLPHITMREDSKQQSRGLYITLLYKRLDSSIYSFVASLTGLFEKYTVLLERTKDIGWERAVAVFTDDLIADEDDDSPHGGSGDNTDKEAIAALECDIEMIKEFMRARVDPLRSKTGYIDPKLEMLQDRLDNIPGKVLVFTQYVDTARYLFDHITDNERVLDCISGTGNLGTDIDTVMKVKLFAPTANEYTPSHDESEIDVLITTDTLAEGVNLQDCRTVINYDIPWNPMRIVQRVGRIDRIGSSTQATVLNILPDKRFDKYMLRLLNTVMMKVDTVTSILGNENQILTDEDDVSPKTFGDKLEEMGEAQTLDEYEKMGRNRLFKNVHTKEDKSELTLKIMEIIKELELDKSDFRTYDRAMYCTVKARSTDKRGIFAMFRVYDGRNRDKLSTVTLFIDRRGRFHKIGDREFLEWIPMHKFGAGERRTNEMTRIVKAIDKHFQNTEFKQICDGFRPSAMGSLSKMSRVQTYVKDRLEQLQKSIYGEELDGDMFRKITAVILRDTEVRLLEKLFGDTKTKHNIFKMDRDDFVVKIDGFYVRYVKNNPQYPDQRRIGDIKYNMVCWGALT